MSNTSVETIYDRANRIVRDRFEYSNVPQEEVNAFRDGLIRGMEEMHEMMSNSTEELYKWHPIVDEGEYWTDYDLGVGSEKIKTIVTNGGDIYSYMEECRPGWSTMAKQGCWKYMRIKLD
jgi:hypothetical protein